MPSLIASPRRCPYISGGAGRGRKKGELNPTPAALLDEATQGPGRAHKKQVCSRFSWRKSGLFHKPDPGIWFPLAFIGDPRAFLNCCVLEKFLPPRYRY